MIINENSLKDFLNRNELIEMADIMSDAFVNHSNFIYTIRPAPYLVCRAD